MENFKKLSVGIVLLSPFFLKSCVPENEHIYAKHKVNRHVSSVKTMDSQIIEVNDYLLVMSARINELMSEKNTEKRKRLWEEHRKEMQRYVIQMHRIMEGRE